MTGKQKCEILKRMRHEIAEKNGIALPEDECTFRGECPGFCEKCDAEARLLDDLLKKKAAAGEQISVLEVSQSSFAEALEEAKAAEEKLLCLSTEGFGLSKKTIKILLRAGVRTVGDLLALTPRELTNIKGVNGRIRAEIEERLSAFGLSLKTVEPPKSSHLMGVTMPDLTGYIPMRDDF